jgi:two-component system, response regulator PdtaR
MVVPRTIHEQLPSPVSPSTVDVGRRPNPSPNPKREASTEGTYNILIVDDELWAALDMEWVVRKLRHEVVGPAATAEEAIKLAETARPDLVLMDIRLANHSDGVAAAVEIRQRFDIPSLFVSAHGDPITRERAIAARPSGFIEKPFTPESLALAIEAALKRSEPSA